MPKELICWDSSVMISWIKETEQERLSAINSVVQKIRQGNYYLTVSTLIYPEVLESVMHPDAIEKFDKFMQNRNSIEIFAVDIRVAKKAQEIRNKTHLTTPDAVHIATAIVCKAAVFHTYDAELLELDEDSKVNGLRITACDIPGMTRSLFY